MGLNVFWQGLGDLYVKYNLRSGVLFQSLPREKDEETVWPDNLTLLISNSQSVTIAVNRHSDVGSCFDDSLSRVFHHLHYGRIGEVNRKVPIQIGVQFDDLAPCFTQDSWDKRAGSSISCVNDHFHRTCHLDAL